MYQLLLATVVRVLNGCSKQQCEVAMSLCNVQGAILPVHARSDVGRFIQIQATCSLLFVSVSVCPRSRAKRSASTDTDSYLCEVHCSSHSQALTDSQL